MISAVDETAYRVAPFVATKPSAVRCGSSISIRAPSLRRTLVVVAARAGKADHDLRLCGARQRGGGVGGVAACTGVQEPLPVGVADVADSGWRCRFRGLRRGTDRVSFLASAVALRGLRAKVQHRRRLRRAPATAIGLAGIGRDRKSSVSLSKLPLPRRWPRHGGARRALTGPAQSGSSHHRCSASSGCPPAPAGSARRARNRSTRSRGLAAARRATTWEEWVRAVDAVVSHRSAAHVRGLGDLIPRGVTSTTSQMPPPRRQDHEAAREQWRSDRPTPGLPCSVDSARSTRTKATEARAGKHDLVEPAPLLAGRREYVADRGPEPQRAVADREHRSSHPAPFGRAQEVGPRLGGLAVAVVEGDQLFSAVGADADHHQQAHLVLFEADLEVDPIDPDVDVVGVLDLRSAVRWAVWYADWCCGVRKHL